MAKGPQVKYNPLGASGDLQFKLKKGSCYQKICSENKYIDRNAL